MPIAAVAALLPDGLAVVVALVDAAAGAAAEASVHRRCNDDIFIANNMKLSDF